MSQTVEKPETEDSEFVALNLERLQAILKDHFKNAATIESTDQWDRLKIDYQRCLNDSLPIACNLSNALRGIAAKCLAAASRIDAEAGYSEAPEFYVREGDRRIAITGLDDDVDIAIFNAKDDADAIRQAREAVAFLINGKQAPKPANDGPVKLEPYFPGEFRFWCGSEKFRNVDLVVHNQSSERQAMAEATAFVEWLQAQSAPIADEQPELKIA